MVIDKLSKKQAEIFQFIDAKEHALICDGAVRSGKTVLMTMAFMMWVMEYFDRTNFAICAKTVQSAERNILRPFQNLEGLPYSVEYKAASSYMIIRCGKKENYIYLFGGKDEASYMLIQGITLAGVFFDEAALQPRSFVEQAVARTLTFPNAKLWFNCNPEGPNHWFYKEWILKARQKHAKRIHFRMEDNPILSKEDIRKASMLFSGVFYERYILGKWVGAEGLIYREFAEHVKDFEIEKVQLPAFCSINIGVDFGGNKSNHAFCAVGITGDMDVVVLRSVSLPAKDVSVDGLIEEFLKFADGILKDFGPVQAVFCDSAEQAIINTMRARTTLPIRNSIKNRITDRIRAESVLFSARRISLLKNENDALINGLVNAVWDPGADGDVRLDNGSSDIDILDAFEYAWEYYMKQLIRICH